MPALSLSSSSLVVTAWVDPVVDALGHDPRSAYVERFWLPIIGPSTTWLARHLVARLEDDPGGATLDLIATAGALGLGATHGRHSPVVRALHRACQFGVARPSGDGAIQIRRALAPLTRHQIQRLPDGVRAAHDTWHALDRDSRTLEAQHRRARRVALALAEMGEDVATSAVRLERWDIHPAVAHEAARWAARLIASRDTRPEPAAPPAPPQAVHDDAA